jgi:hypothetical protein
MHIEWHPPHAPRRRLTGGARDSKNPPASSSRSLPRSSSTTRHHGGRPGGQRQRPNHRAGRPAPACTVSLARRGPPRFELIRSPQGGLLAWQLPPLPSEATRTRLLLHFLGLRAEAELSTGEANQQASTPQDTTSHKFVRRARPCLELNSFISLLLPFSDRPSSSSSSSSSFFLLLPLFFLLVLG